MTERERMLAGELYLASAEELVQARQDARRLTRQINATEETETARREALFRALFCSIGENFCIEPPFRCDYGKNIRIGSDFYANFDCIILDVAPVTIGDHVFFGPRVSLYAAGHPIDATVRDSLLEYGKPITIGSHVWIGGNTVINPGVTVGDNVVIGAGSVVTRDIPKNCVAAGVPCRVIREITDADRAYWQAQADRRRGEAG